MDQVRQLTGVDAAVAKYGVTGRGVIVALLDRGIDWKNPDFQNADGTTRIAYIFDLTDNTGAFAPGNTYGFGTIYTRAQIDDAVKNHTPLATRDALGHGSTTAGIAAGNGRNNAKYRGVATDAVIIAVKVTSEGVGAHDGEPAEPPFYNPAILPVAIDFVRDKAHELGLPAVMLLNLGSQGGPTDGTSDFARKIDATVGPGIPGLVFVTGAGDDGGVANRAGGNVPAGGSVSIQIKKGYAVPPIFNLFYSAADRFDVTIQGPSGTVGPYPSPATNADADSHQTADALYYHYGNTLSPWGSQLARREIWIRLEGPIGTYTVTLTGKTVTTGRFDATLGPSNEQFFPETRFLTNVAPGSVWDGCTAHNNICPNAYINKESWTDIDGFPRDIPAGQGHPGEIWKGSSVGPTFDGRLGIDVSAPGTILFTTYNPTSYFATFRSNMINDGGGLYGGAGAVSAAAPSVTGIIALMLQANPSLDAAQVKQILQQTAKSDSFTGTTPNTTWGYGKVDALGAVGRAAIGPCVAGTQNLCLAGNRFRVHVAWAAKGRTGAGTAIALTGDTGYFWFFSSANIELVLKVLDARAISDFYLGLLRCALQRGVRDHGGGHANRGRQGLQEHRRESRQHRRHEGLHRPRPCRRGDRGGPLPAGDRGALGGGALRDVCRADVGQGDRRGSGGRRARAAPPTRTTLCLNQGRFQVRVDWAIPSKNRSGQGMAVPITADTGYFWFFSNTNVELVIKVLDARAICGFYWVFYGALSNVQYTITVRDTQTGVEKVYQNVSGNLASVADTKAF